MKPNRQMIQSMSANQFFSPDQTKKQEFSKSVPQSILKKKQIAQITGKDTPVVIDSPNSNVVPIALEK